MKKKFKDTAIGKVAKIGVDIGSLFVPGLSAVSQKLTDTPNSPSGQMSREAKKEGIAEWKGVIKAVALVVIVLLFLRGCIDPEQLDKANEIIQGIEQ